MSITLAEPLEKWVREQAEAQGLKDADAYVIQVLQAEQKRLAVEKLVKNLEEAEASGSHEVTDEIWEERQHRVAVHFNKVKKPIAVK